MASGERRGLSCDPPCLLAMLTASQPLILSNSARLTCSLPEGRNRGFSPTPIIRRHL